jgi:long-chain acyl-CoA synthetase
MIIKGGVNIYPIEIEKELLKLDYVEDAFVTKQKDIIKGEIIIAFVKMKSLGIFDESLIKNELKEVLSGIKIPDKIFAIANFEYTNTGKKLKPQPTFSPQ